MEPQQPPKPPQPVKQPLKISDEQAQSILAINSLDTKLKTQSSKSFLVLVIGFIVVVVALSLFLEARNHSKSNAASNTSSSSSSTKNPFTSGNGSVDSEVKYCSNPVNAQLTC